MSKKFQRKIEDFTCENCDTFVKGDGYTNHCPKCLWSKHVDINPGDRNNSCRGLMEPVGLFFKNQQWHIVFRCIKCQKENNFRINEKDDQEMLKKILDNQQKTAP